MSAIYVVSARRSPIGSFSGSLSSSSSVALGEAVISQALQDCACDPKNVEELIMGHVLTAGLGQNPTRELSLRVGVPVTSPAYSINMLCGSGLEAVILGVKSLKCDGMGIVVAGGMESMSNAPHCSVLRKSVKFGSLEFIDTVLNDGLTCGVHKVHMGVTAEHVAKVSNVSRQEQDEFALNSQEKCTKAQEMGFFDAEIVPIKIPVGRSDTKLITKDEFPKPKTTIEGLCGLKPCFVRDGTGTVTPGNSSGINDGAAAVVLMSSDQVEQRGLSPLAEIVSYASVGVEPMEMGLGPVPAVRKALGKANWSIESVDLFELNEAFAAQSVAVVKELGLDVSKVNVSGGAIALGHPIGASGARILVTLLHSMKRLNVKRGVASLCVGGGMGVAMCVQRMVD